MVAASRGLADSHHFRTAADAGIQQDGRADLTEAEDASRFTEMYQKYRARVFSYAVTTVGRDLAEEITSDVFLIAWQRITDVPEKPLPWLLVTARNVGSNQVEAAIRQRALAAEMAAWIPREQQSGDVADQVAERAALLAALATLAEPDRQLLTLTAASAARVIGCSTATYFVRLHRARRRLRQAIAAATREPAPARHPAQAPAARLHDHAHPHDQDKDAPGGDQRRQPRHHAAARPKQKESR
jgi:RNA polymerase sigma-70 factor, ECF subfamily